MVKLVQQYFSQSAKKFPEKVAVNFGNQNITFYTKRIPVDFLKDSRAATPLESDPNDSNRTYPYNAVVYLKEEKRIASIHGNDIFIWNLNGSIFKTLVGHKEKVFSLCLLPDGRIASGDQAGNIFIWDTKNESRFSIIQGAMGNAILSIIPLHETGTNWDGTIASAAVHVMIWDINNLKPNEQGIVSRDDHLKTSIMRENHPPSTFTYSLAFIQGGKLAIGYSDNKILIVERESNYDPNKGYKCRDGDKEVADSGPIYSLLTIPGTTRLISGSNGGRMRAWDLSNLENITFKSFNNVYEDIIFSLASGSDGQLISGTSNGLFPENDNKPSPIKIRTWNLSDLSFETQLINQTQNHFSIAHISDDIFVSASIDGTINYWKNSLFDEISHIKEKADAIDFYERALSFDPSQYDLYNRLSNLYEKHSVPASKKMQLFLSGISYYESKDSEKAEEFYRNAIHIDVENPNIHLARLSSNTTKIFESYRSLIAIYENCGLLSHHLYYLEKLVSLDLDKALLLSNNDERTLAKIKTVALKKVKTIHKSDPNKATKICETIQRQFNDHKSAIFLYDLTPSDTPAEQIRYYYHVSEHAFQKEKYKKITEAFLEAKKKDDDFTGLKEEEKLTFFTRKLTADLFLAIEKIDTKNEKQPSSQSYPHPKKSSNPQAESPTKYTFPICHIPISENDYCTPSCSSLEDSNNDLIQPLDCEQQSKIHEHQSSRHSSDTNNKTDETSKQPEMIQTTLSSSTSKDPNKESDSSTLDVQEEDHFDENRQRCVIS